MGRQVGYVPGQNRDYTSPDYVTQRPHRLERLVARREHHVSNPSHTLPIDREIDDPIRKSMLNAVRRYFSKKSYVSSNPHLIEECDGYGKKVADIRLTHALNTTEPIAANLSEPEPQSDGKSPTFLKRLYGTKLGQSIALGLALTYSLALAPPVYASEHETKETEAAAVSVEDKTPSKPAIITLLRFEITDPTLADPNILAQKFGHEYYQREFGKPNTTSIVWGVKPERKTLGNILRHADEPFTRLNGDRYVSNDAHTIDRILCGSGVPDDFGNEFGKIYYILKAAGMHTREDIDTASNLYRAGCFNRDPDEVGKAFDAMTLEQRTSVLKQMNRELYGNFGGHEIKAELDRGLSPRIDKYILKAFDSMYRLALMALGIKALTRAFSSGGGHGHAASSSSSAGGGGAPLPPAPLGGG